MGTTTALEIHALALIFPAMSDEDFARLRESVKAIGQQEPIWTHDGKVIDGRHRLRACEELGIDPWVEERELRGQSVLDVVLALNDERRHLTTSQRAMVAARLSQVPDGAEDAAVEISTAGRVKAAAERMRVDRASVYSALKVLGDAVPELAASVERGEASVSAAATVAKLPKGEQKKAAAGGKKGVSDAAKKAKGGGKSTPPPWVCPDCEESVPAGLASDHECGEAEPEPEAPRSKAGKKLTAEQVEAAKARGMKVVRAMRSLTKATREAGFLAGDTSGDLHPDEMTRALQIIRADLKDPQVFAVEVKTCASVVNALAFHAAQVYRTR